MVMSPSTVTMTRTTTAPVNSGIGSLNGIAAQLSLPSISASRRRRHRLVDDAFEQLRHDRAIGRRWHGLARFRQFGIAGIVERRAGAAYPGDPAVEIAGRHRLG